MRGMGPVRQRNGASSWRMFRDLGEDGKYVERYILSSWAEYVRLRSRMTIADRQVHEDIAKLQRPDTPIRVSRLLGIDLTDVERRGRRPATAPPALTRAASAGSEPATCSLFPAWPAWSAHTATPARARCASSARRAASPCATGTFSETSTYACPPGRRCTSTS